MSRSTTLSSGLLATGTNAVATGKNLLNAVTVISDGVAAATVIVYDNPSAASGKVLAKATADISNPTEHLVFPNAVRAELGITVEVTGANAGAVVYFGAA